MTEGSRSSTVSPWVRVWLPSVGDLIFMLILAMLTCTQLSVRMLNDGGIGWHIRAGQMMVANGGILQKDSFSSIMNVRPWFAWEWLFDIIAGQCERFAGLNGVVWLSALPIAAVFSAAFRWMVNRGTRIVVSLILVLLAAAASMIHFLARPHVFSWVFALIWFCLLDSSERELTGGKEGRSAKTLWVLPAVMLVWVNVHGSFLLGFLLLAIYTASAAYIWITSREPSWDHALFKLRAARRVRLLVKVGVASAFVSLCNPYGWRLHEHIYRYLTDRFLMNRISEFQSPNFHGLAARCFAGLLLIALLALMMKVRALRLSEGLIVLLAVYSGLFAVRNLPVSSLLLVCVCGPLFAQGLSKTLLRHNGFGLRKFFERMENVELQLSLHVWPVALSFALLVVALYGGRIGPRVLMNAHFSEERFPTDAVTRVEAGRIWGPILAPDFWGGYLIYRLYPRTRVVMDDRHDLYGDKIFRGYIDLVEARPGWEKFLVDHDVCCILADKGSTFANIVALSPHWKEIYRDEVAVAFEKNQ